PARTALVYKSAACARPRSRSRRASDAAGRNQMRRRFRSVLIPVGSGAASALLWLVVTATAGQAPTAGRFPPSKAPRLAGHADLNGVWQAFVPAHLHLED